MDANGARLTTFLDDDAILGFPDDYVQQRDRHPMDWIAAGSASAALLGGTVGVEMDAYFFTPARLRGAAGGRPARASWTAHELVNWVRAVKSPAEIDCMRDAARIAERVMRGGHRRDRARRAPVRRRGGDLRRAGARDGGDGRRLPGDRADAADRRGHLDAAPDVERRAVRARRGDDPRARGLPPPLPLPDRAHRVPRRPAGEADRDGAAHRRGPGDGARRGRARA